MSEEKERSPTDDKVERSGDECCVVGIGTSAGGLKALNQFFDAMPSNSGMSFVVIQHLDPNHETLLPELLEKQTDMQVRLAIDGEEIAPNTVYVIPPDNLLTVENRTLHLTAYERPREPHAPIDVFLRSLSEAFRERAIGIILSGNGSDGTLGIREVKEAGGMVVVQDPSTAQYESMPYNAIQTGLVDFVLSPEKMPEKLLHYNRTKESLDPSEVDNSSEINDQLGTITGILRRATGHDFKGYKGNTLARRVQRRINISNVSNVVEYISLLQSDIKETHALFQDFLISVTSFFRNQEAFQTLADDMIPAIFLENEKEGHASIRVWVPGCASGEEAYTIAMLMLDYCDLHEITREIKIFATDLDEIALKFARRGTYPEGILEQVPKPYLDRYFTRQGTSYRVKKQLRDLIIFSPHNLLKDPPFSRLDLLSCRNLMIYLKSEEQKQLLRIFHYALRSYGILFLGSSENVATHSQLFRTLSKKHRIFRQNDSILRLSPYRERSERTELDYRAYLATSEGVTKDRTPRGRELVDQVVLRHYGPTYVVVDETRQILFSSGETADYFELPEGNISTNVIDMAQRGIRLDLRSALHEAFRSHESVKRGPILFEGRKGDSALVQLTVHPVTNGSQEDPIMLVLIEKISNPPDYSGGLVNSIDGEHPAILHLEDELRMTREQLQTTIEELETTNEELKSSNEELLSMNEELQSSNEELQTSKEEIQSINEELYTVNAELNQKIEELNNSNSDLQNLFQSTHIPTLFVDSYMRIKRFTPEIDHLFRMIESDIGRSISDVRPRFREIGLENHIREVIGSLSVYEQEIQLPEDGTSYILRISPYRTVNNVIDGVVLTFSDITFLRRAEKGERYIAAMLEYVPEGIMLVDAETMQTEFISRAGCRMLGREGDFERETLEQSYGPSVMLREDGKTSYEMDDIPVVRAIRTGETIYQEKIYIRRGEELLPILYNASPVYDDEGTIVAGVATWSDISQLEETRIALQKSTERYRVIATELETLYAHIPIGLSVHDSDFRYLRINKYLADMHGIPIEEHLGKDPFELVPEMRESIEPIIKRVMETGEPALNIEVTTPIFKGETPIEGQSLSYWQVSYLAVKSPDREESYLVSMVQNITKRRMAEIGLQVSRKELRLLNERLEERVSERIEQVRALSSALALAERSERRRLSFLLHDDLQQILFGLEIKMQLARRRVADEEQSRMLQEFNRDLLDFDKTLLQAIKVTRTLSVELNPPLEHDTTVEAALNWVVEHVHEQHVLEVDVDIEDGLEMPNVDMRALMVQLIRELLFNVVKHAGTLKAELHAQRARSNFVSLRVRDSGAGFDVSQIEQQSPKGLGLYSIRERVEVVGGYVEIESTPGEGTSVTVTLPLSV